jgi:hypothetical protein
MDRCNARITESGVIALLGETGMHATRVPSFLRCHVSGSSGRLIQDRIGRKEDFDDEEKTT